MMGKDERGCEKVPFGGYLKVPDNIKRPVGNPTGRFIL